MKFWQLCAICGGGFLLLRYGAPVLFPIFCGALLSSLTCRCTDRIAARFSWDRRRCALIGAVVVGLCALGLLAAAVLLCGSVLSGAFLRGLYESVTALVESWRAIPRVGDRICDFLENAAGNLVREAAFWAGRRIGAAGEVLTRIVVGACVFFFRCGGGATIPDALLCHLPYRETIARVLEFAERLIDAAGQYVRAAWVLGGGAFALFALGLALLRQENALFLAFLAAVADVLPVVGAGIVLVPWAVTQFLRGRMLAGWLILALLFLQWSVRQLLEPRFYGRALRLSPCLTVVAAYLGYTAAGFSGMLLLPLALSAAVSGNPAAETCRTPAPGQ